MDFDSFKVVWEKIGNVIGQLSSYGYKSPNIQICCDCIEVYVDGVDVLYSIPGLLQDSQRIFSKNDMITICFVFNYSD